MADSGTNPVRPNTFELEADVNVEFNEAASRQQINSGESVKTLFGKLRKFLTDLKTVAFSGEYGDLSGKPDLSQFASKGKYGDTTINVGRRDNAPIGEYSSALGIGAVANGYAATAEGSGSQAAGHASHAGGYNSHAIKDSSFAHGYQVDANHDYETAFGKHNVSNDDTLFSIGDGTSEYACHNAFEITTTGGKLHDKDIAVKDDIPAVLPANGGTADTARQVVGSSSKIRLWEDNEGGNLELVAPDGVHMMQMDIYNNADFRMYFYDGSQLIFPANYSFSTGKFDINGNADTVDGMHASDFCYANSPRITGAIRVNPNTEGNYSEGIRIANATNGFSDIVLGAVDDYGITSTGIYIGKTASNEFVISRGGSGDSSNGSLRLDTNGNWNVNGSNHLIHSGNIGSQSVNYANGAGNADTVDGMHAWNLITLSADGNSHGTSFPMYCRYNVLGDGKFYIGVSGGYERSVAVGYAETAGSVPVSAIIKSATFTVTTNSAGWNTLGITYPAYNIIGYQCNTSDYRVELYKGNSATEWYVYAIQQYPNPGVVATNKAVSVTIFYI